MRRAARPAAVSTFVRQHQRMAVVTAGSRRRHASCPSRDRRAERLPTQGAGFSGAEASGGLGAPRRSAGQPSGRGPRAERPENQRPAAARLNSGRTWPPPEPRSFRKLAAPISAPTNLLRLDHALQLYLLGFTFPNFFRPALP